MMFVAQELREYMARLGVRTVDQLVGRSDLLQVREKLNTRRAETLDLRYLLTNPGTADTPHFHPQAVYDFHLEKTADMSVLMEKLGKSLKGKKSGRLDLAVSSTDRAFGTLFGQALIQEYPDCADGKYKFECTGYAGESFGAFLPRGAVLHLTGQANDYVGKGLSGGVIAVSAPARLQAQADRNIILGNVALYGATGGALYVNGAAGERFGVRNSGALGIAEGVGEHGAEYMVQFYHPVAKIYIAYDREAWEGLEEPDLRITFDTDLRYRTHERPAGPDAFRQ